VATRSVRGTGADEAGQGVPGDVGWSHRVELDVGADTDRSAAVVEVAVEEPVHRHGVGEVVVV